MDISPIGNSSLAVALGNQASISATTMTVSGTGLFNPVDTDFNRLMTACLISALLNFVAYQPLSQVSQLRQASQLLRYDSTMSRYPSSRLMISIVPIV